MHIITQVELGQRIAEVRKLKGLSQDELSSLISLSRPVVTQIELGNRKLSVLELQKISLVLKTTMDEIVSENFSITKTLNASTEPLTEEHERVSTPVFNSDKFQNILLYILEKCAGKPNVNESFLYKLLYFSDFNYYEIYEEHLSSTSYRKLAFGPVPQHLQDTITDMIHDEIIHLIKTQYLNVTQTRYLPLSKPDLSTFNAQEKDIIDKVIDQFSDWSDNALSAYSHLDMPWKATSQGEVIDYELAFYREAPFTVRNYN